MGKKSTQRRKLTMKSSVRTLSIKCYMEQLPSGIDELKERIEALPKDEKQVLMIVHNRDTATDDYWEPSKEKEHIHIIVRLLNGKTTHVSTLLNELGVVYRKGKDDTLFQNHGVETVLDFASMAMYLTHETEQAILDGKEKYELSEIVSNLNMDEIKQVREGYTRLSMAKSKMSMDDWTALDKAAYQLGYDLKNFNDWYEKLPFDVRSNAKLKAVRESYYLGMQKRAELHENMNRLCVYIQGSAGTGKTYASLRSFEGLKVYSVKGGGTGLFDRLTPSHEVIIVDDYTAPNLLNMCDNYICEAHKRGRDNPYWCGTYFIVTSNLPFSEWVKGCGLEPYEYHNGKRVHTENYKAMLTRFYLCEVESKDGINQLVCSSVSTRGTVKEQEIRRDRFIAFKDKFNKIMKSYVPEAEKVDYSMILKS